MGSVKEIKRFGANRTIRKPYVGFPPKGSKLNLFDALAPSALALAVINDTSIKLDFTVNSTNADGHKIERSTDGTTYTEIGSVTGTTATYTDAGLTEGTRYYYKARAYKASAYSAYCTAVDTYAGGWYGIERDNTIASPDWTRIASSAAQMTLHASLPVHALFKPCVMNVDKTVNYYLKPDDFSKKIDGVTASVITGADGNVMSHQSASYWKFTEKVGNVERIKISHLPHTGWVEITPQFYSCYEGNVAGGKLNSISGVLATTSVSETTFRGYARANGAGHEQQWIRPYSELVHLFMVQFATNNMQKPVNMTLTVDGYSQGGLGAGVTTANATEWNNFNGYKPFITNGACNTMPKHYGEVSVVVANFGGAGVNRTFSVPRFLYIENLFGHIWKWVDGVTINNLASTREAYVFDNPAQFVDGSSVNGRLAGLLPNETVGYIATVLFPEILPAILAGNQNERYCDYYYAPALNTGWRALVSGGHADLGVVAGAFCAGTHAAASGTDAYVGARLHVK